MEREQEDKHHLDREELKSILEHSLEQENDLLRTYVITSERIHDNDHLKVRLQNFAEGNAKRTKQLMVKLDAM